MAQPVRFVARYAMGKSSLLLLGGVFFVAICIWAIDRADGFRAILAGLGAVFFGICVALILSTLFDRRDILVVDRNGFRDLRLSSKPIAWRNVTALGEWSHRGQRFILVTLRVPLDKSSQTTFQSLTVQVNRWFTGHDLYIAVSGLTAGYDDIADAIRRYAPPRLTAGPR